VWKRVTARHGAQFVKHVVPAVVKPARILWNEVIGFLFISLGVVFGFRAGQLYLAIASSAADEQGAALARFVLAAFCTALMLYFGITSFWRARKISRS
jgi:hypothetical protein